MTNPLKTSSDWSQRLGIVVIDADGWDRSNYDYSYHVELISYDEYMVRKSQSNTFQRTKEQW